MPAKERKIRANLTDVFYEKGGAAGRTADFSLHGDVQCPAGFGLWSRGGFRLKQNIGSAKVLKRIAALAFGRANDAVKLTLLDTGQIELDKLDLSLLSEVKRGSNGAIEVKLLNRLDALELLARLVGAGDGQTAAAESFFQALDAAAKGRPTLPGQSDG